MNNLDNTLGALGYIYMYPYVCVSMHVWCVCASMHECMHALTEIEMLYVVVF